MNALDYIVLIVSAATSFAYICRLAALQWGKHKPVVIILHASLGIAALVAGVHAWESDTTLIEVAALVGAASWIVLSLHTWAKGEVPKQFDSSPVPLDEAQAEHVSGGKKS